MNNTPIIKCEGSCGWFTRHVYIEQRRVKVYSTGLVPRSSQGYEQRFKCAGCGHTRRFGLTSQPLHSTSRAAA